MHTLRISYWIALITILGMPLEIHAQAKGSKVKITRQPSSRTVELGDRVDFTVAYSSAGAASVQWRLQGAAIPYATSDTHTIIDALPTHSGRYDAVVTNAAGSVTSKPAVLVVNLAPPSLAVDTVIDANLTVNYGKTTETEDGAYLVSGASTLKDVESPNDPYTFVYRRTARDRALLNVEGSFHEEDLGLIKTKETYQLTFTNLTSSGLLKANVSGSATFTLPAGSKPARISVKFKGTMTFTTKVYQTSSTMGSSSTISGVTTSMPINLDSLTPPQTVPLFDGGTTVTIL